MRAQNPSNREKFVQNNESNMRIRIIIVIELYTKWLIMDEPTGFYLITYSMKPFHKSSTLQIVVE